MIFDGKAFAREIEELVKNKVRNLVIKPHIVSLLVGDDPASVMYTRLKKAAAERVGIVFEIVKQTNVSTNQLKNIIAEIGKRQDVTGVMVQLPIPGLQGLTLREVLSAIPLEKDVDGLRWEESGVMPATVRAILATLNKIAHESRFKIRDSRIVVVGSRGAVGRPLVYWLREKYGVIAGEVEWDTPEPTRSHLEGSVVISCVGKAGLVKGEMISSGAIAIDVGMSEVEGKVVGDMVQEVYQKASVAVPVPGGVGPVTVASLMSNAVDLI